jgi:AraC family transcriptional regulator of adaptative response / DNA-3-methyladenine glycosylase II
MRPVCAARTPRRSSCDFYRTAAGAEHAGFRPCLRCRPELAPGRADFNATLAGSILTHLQAGASTQAPAKRSRVTSACRADNPAHTARSFRRDTDRGCADQRLLFAKKTAAGNRTVDDAARVRSGFQSVRRFNAAFHEQYRLAPTQLRRHARTNRQQDVQRLQPTSQVADADITLRLAYRPRRLAYGL